MVLMASVQNISPFLIERLTLLFQMIFYCGIIPALLSTRVITPILKKGKPLDQYSSFRTITMSAVLSRIFESLIIDKISGKCYTSDSRFGFKKGVNRHHAHHLIANLLLHAHENKEVLCFAGLDVYGHSVHLEGTFVYYITFALSVKLILLPKYCCRVH